MSLNMTMISEDTIEEILLKLPVKSLVRFKSVRKKWLDLIESSAFIKSHLKLERHNHILLKCFDGIVLNENAISCYDNYESMDSPPPYYFRSHDFDLTEYPKFSRLMDFACCTHSNGIVCLTDWSDIHCSPIILFNPALREFKSLPPCPISCPNPRGCENCCKLVGYGFGFDAAIDNFKVVRMMFRHDFLPPGSSREYYIEAQVYDLSTNCWRRSGHMNNIFPTSLVRFIPPVLFNGILHYICCQITDPQHILRILPSVILTFNLSTELFEIMELPVHWKDYYVESSMESSVFMADESTLALVTFTYPTPFLPLELPLEMNFTCVQLDVWLMKEYGVRESWTKQYSIMSPNSRLGRPLTFVKKDKLLFLTAYGNLICYDLPTGQQRQLRRYEFRRPGRLDDIFYKLLCSFGVVLCTESLVSFKN